MKIAIASDHAGFKLKKYLVEKLKSDFEIIDYGTNNEVAVDYPDFASKVCRKIISKEVESGILICGTGIGMSIAANKYNGIRAANCSSEYEAEMSRKHNNANIVTLGERIVKKIDALKIIKIFLNTKFEAERHQKRVEKISCIEDLQNH